MRRPTAAATTATTTSTTRAASTDDIHVYGGASAGRHGTPVPPVGARGRNQGPHIAKMDIFHDIFIASGREKLAMELACGLEVIELESS